MDGPEWVELVNAPGGDVDLSGWRILDSRGGDGGVIGDEVVALPAGHYLMVAQDASMFHFYNPV